MLLPDSATGGSMGNLAGVQLYPQANTSLCHSSLHLICVAVRSATVARIASSLRGTPL